ncbi:MAG: hypothetical protein ACI9KE_004890 [Polyangiales bacterium]|jgi:hypothetical protein
MKARFRLFARGLRRRLSNLAWGLAVGSVAVLIIQGAIRGLLPLRSLPQWLEWGSSLAICVSLLTTVAASGIAVLQYAREVTASADSTGVRVTKGGRTKQYSHDELGAVLRHQDRVWVFLRNGSVMDFAFEEVEEATAFEAMLREQIAAGRIELLPHPTVATAPFVLVTMLAMLTAWSIASSLVSVLDQPHLVVPSLVLATTVLAAARLGVALRGRKFVLGRDGIRLDGTFFPFDRIKTVQIANERVTLVDLDGKSVRVKVRMPVELADALNAEFVLRLNAKGAREGLLEREPGEAVHAWLERTRASIRDTGFRNPAMQKERIRVAALHPKSPLRVRVAALAGLMEEDPELAEELLAVSADPRLEKAAKAAQGSADGWRRAVERLERDGALE